MLHARKVFSFRSGLHNIRPARSFLAARENSVAENVAKARLRIITCPFRISSTLWRNRLLRPAASLCWSICPFELSELCRPALEEHFSIWKGTFKVSNRRKIYLDIICFQISENINVPLKLQWIFVILCSLFVICDGGARHMPRACSREELLGYMKFFRVICSSVEMLKLNTVREGSRIPGLDSSSRSRGDAARPGTRTF